MNLPRVFSDPCGLYLKTLRPLTLALISALAVAACGGGGSASAPSSGAAVDGGGNVDNPDGGEQPVPPVVNSSPTVDSFVATANGDNPLLVTFSWQVSDADADMISCELDPGGGQAVELIADCSVTTQMQTSYSSDGDVTATLTAIDSNDATDSSVTTFTVSSPVTLTGVVTSYPDSTDAPSADGTNGSIILSDADGDTNSLSRQDMTPVEALVSLFLLTDVNFAEPVATVKTDSAGHYEVTASDVRDYLLAVGAVDEGTPDADVITAFRSLGRLQIRALIVSDRDGQSQALAIQTIADPSNIDHNGVPVPVDVDPITHRVVKAIVDQIRESVSSLVAMGLPPTVVDDLLDTVINTVVVEIDRVLEETADDLIEIPEGQSVAEVVQSQEQELAVSLEENDVDQLAALLESESDVIEDSALADLESNVVSAEVVVEDSQSNLQGSLDSESQGLLSGLEAVISENVTDTVEQRIEQAQQVGTDEALAEIFGERDDNDDFQQLVEAAQAEKDRVQRRSLQRFFLSLGLAVVVEENATGDAGVIALRLPQSILFDGVDLPGAPGFDERAIRLFKVGDGVLDADSHYTSDPLVPLSVIDGDGDAVPPYAYVPRLDDILAEITGSSDWERLQQQVDDAWLSINRFDSVPTDADFDLIDRIAILNELHERLQHSTLVSTRVIDSIVDNRSSQTNIKRLASVIADHFQWVGEEVHLTPEGFPIFTDRRGPLRAGGHVVDSSELIRALSFTLGDTATQTAQVLTGRESFYAQYAAEAIDTAIQLANVSGTDSLDFSQLLLDIYPADASGFRDLIVGVNGVSEASYAYQRARDRVAGGLTAALPRELFGQTLTSESSVPIRTALFLLDYVLNGNYLIDASRGYFTEFKIITDDGEINTRYVPNYNNQKQLEPTGDISVATIVSSLLSVTEIDDGDLFEVAARQLASGLGDIPVLPQYREQDIEDFGSDLGERANRVAASCTIERFDGQDPELGADHQRLSLSVFGVEYVPDTGEFIKGNRIDASISSELVDVDGLQRRTYTIEELSALDGADYGRDYVLRFEIDGYQNELPEIFFHADGYVPHLDLCPRDAPLFIGPDIQFTQVPGLGLISDQHRPGLEGDEPEGIDVSNLEVPGAPLYLTAEDEAAGQGRVDLLFISSAAGFHLTAAENTDTAFAPLYALVEQGEFRLTLAETTDSKPLFGMQSVVGHNVRELIEQATVAPDLMTSGLDVVVGNVAPERLYLMRDADGRYWILEIRFADFYTDFHGSTQAFVDIGVASVNAIGDVTAPDVAFDEAVAEPYDASTGGITYHRLYYGDWLVLDNPDGYSGLQLLPAEQLSFAATDGYTLLGDATDGVFIRYAGVHFDENIQMFEDLDTVFGVPPNYSSLPVRLDAGRPGLTFVKLGFSRQDKRYLMEPTPQEAGSFTTNLVHNDLIAIFDQHTDDDGPLYLGRVIRDLPADDPYGHFEMGLEIIRFDVLDDDFQAFDEREVVCFHEEDRDCPLDYPELAFASDIDTVVGIVYDRDYDGLPSLFDPNDHDPNIPGQLPGTTNEQPGNDFDLLTMHATTRTAGDGSVSNALVLETRNVYPGEIASISLSGAVFGEVTDLQTILLCAPEQFSDTGFFEPPQCETLPVSGDVQIELDATSDFELGVSLLVPDATRQTLGEYVSLDYEIEFHPPLGPDGTVLVCGDAECPSRPGASGQITVALPDELPVVEELSLSVDGELSSLSELSTIDVSREVRLFGAVVPGAIEYELTMVCAATGDDAHFLPQEHFQIYAPARDHTGAALQPEFYFHVPWLAGRNCDIEMRAPIENDAGDLAGYSVYRRESIATTEISSPGYLDNEIDLIPGQSLCIAGDGTHLQAEACQSERILFNYDGPLSFTDNGFSTVQLSTGSDVVGSQLDSQAQMVLQGRLNADAFVAFNTADNPNDFLPTCGAISSDPASFSCFDTSSGTALEDAFVASPDLSELALLPHLHDLGLNLLGELNSDGNIPLFEPGEYWLQVPETDELLEIFIEVFFDADHDEREVYVHFQRGGLPSFDSVAGVVEAVVPGFAYLEHQSGIAADVELRHLDGDILRVAWYLLDARPALNGQHDFNGDGEPELYVAPETDGWYFEFSETLDSVLELDASGAFETPRDSDGKFRLFVGFDRGSVEFALRQHGTEYFIRAEPDAASGHLEVIAEHIFDHSAEELFDGLPTSSYFPTGLSVASPFANDVSGQLGHSEGFGVFLSDTDTFADLICADGAVAVDGQCADGSPPFDPTGTPGTTEFPVDETACFDPASGVCTFPVDGIDAQHGAFDCIADSASTDLCVDADGPFIGNPDGNTGESSIPAGICPDGSEAIDGIFCDLNGQTSGPDAVPPSIEFCSQTGDAPDPACEDGETVMPGHTDFPTDASCDESGTGIDPAELAHCAGHEFAEPPLIDYDPIAIRGADAIRSDAERIARVLTGRDHLAERLHTDGLIAASRHAACFGPSMDYRDHPDGTDRSGQIATLPGGDLGIWAHYDATSGHVCAAAQLNEQLSAARQRTTAGLLLMAATVRQLHADEQQLLLDGGSVNVADRLQAQGVAGIEFDHASVARDPDTGSWHYHVTLQQFDSALGDARSSDIALLFNPSPNGVPEEFSGLLQISAEDSVDSGNCPDAAVRHLSSVAFQRLQHQQIRSEYRHGMYCGHAAIGSGFDPSGQVDPGYSQLLFDDGWANDFSVFQAEFNPTNNAGSYAYSWQAGAGDSHSRVLNVGIVGPDALHGDAWFGYGQSLVTASDRVGTINGFICNWAGPGADHSLIERAQYQSLMLDENALQIAVGEGGSNITFAPTNACVYNTDNGGSFLYDRNLNGDLSDESAETVDVGEGENLSFDLAPPETSAFAGIDIEEVIAVRGFIRPQSPVVATTLE